MQKVDSYHILDWTSEPFLNPNFTTGLVSVIVGTYNHAHMIAETLDSVWNQSYRPIELLIVDDGSQDNTEEVVNQWMKDHNNDSDFMIKYFYQKNYLRF